MSVSSLGVDNRPEMPGLETVEASFDGESTGAASCMIAGAFSFFLLLAAACSGVILFCIIRSAVSAPPISDWEIALSGVLILGIAYPLYSFVRILSSPFSWRADKQALTVHRLWGRRSIKWAEVESAVTTRSRLLGKPVYRVQAGRTSIPIPGGRDDFSRVAASVWQHLNRLGKAGALTLDERAASVWEPIPDEVPYGMEWQNRRVQRRTRLTFALLIVTIVLASAIGVLWQVFGTSSRETISWDAAPLSVLVTLLAGIPLLWLAKPFETGRFALREDSYEAVGLGTRVSRRWSEVVSATWRRNAIDIHTAGDKVSLPFVSQDSESARLILAVIRRLRTVDNPQALTIPRKVLQAAGLR